MRIQLQLGLGFGAVVGVGALACAIALQSQRELRRATEAAAEEGRIHVEAAQLERAVTKLAEAANLAAARAQPGAELIGDEGRRELATAIADLEGHRLDEALAAELDELKLLAGSVAAASTGVASLTGRSHAAADPRSERRLLRTLAALDARRQAMSLKAELFADHVAARAQAARHHAQALWSWTISGTAMLVALAFGLAVSLSVVLARRLARPIEALAAVARRVGAGDLDARSGRHTRDEVGELARVFDGMVRDLQVAQARLVQAERLAALGELAVAVKHELNNPLCGILSTMEVLLAHEVAPGPATREGLVLVRDAARRMAEVVGRLDRVDCTGTVPYVGDVKMLALRPPVG